MTISSVVPGHTNQTRRARHRSLDPYQGLADGGTILDAIDMYVYGSIELL